MGSDALPGMVAGLIGATICAASCYLLVLLERRFDALRLERALQDAMTRDILKGIEIELRRLAAVAERERFMEDAADSDMEIDLGEDDDGRERTDVADESRLSDQIRDNTSAAILRAAEAQVLADPFRRPREWAAEQDRTAEGDPAYPAGHPFAVGSEVVVIVGGPGRYNREFVPPPGTVGIVRPPCNHGWPADCTQVAFGVPHGEGAVDNHLLAPSRRHPADLFAKVLPALEADTADTWGEPVELEAEHGFEETGANGATGLPSVFCGRCGRFRADPIHGAG